MTANIGEPAISVVSSIVPATAGVRCREVRHIARKVVGRPMTASLRTAGQSAVSTAMPSPPVTRSSTNSVPPATINGTTCSAVGFVPKGGSKTGSMCRYTAATAAPTSRAMTGRMTACTASMTPANCFQWRRMVENDPPSISPRANGRRGITPGCGAGAGAQPPHGGVPPQPPPWPPHPVFCVMYELRRSSPEWSHNVSHLVRGLAARFPLACARPCTPLRFCLTGRGR